MIFMVLQTVKIIKIQTTVNNNNTKDLNAWVLTLGPTAMC